jgi:ABC-2 type transport system permease protein
MMVIHGEKLRWLFWLRWKLFLRSFSRDRSRIISTIFLVLFGIPFFGGIAVATVFGYRLLPYPANSELLFLVLTGIYLMWLALPLLEFTVNEGLDVSKLMPFPLTRLELMASLLLSTLLDIPMFGLMLVLLAVIIGWAVSAPVAIFTILAMLVFYVQIVGMSQLVLALLMRTLQSRRFRDLSILVIALFSTACYLSSQLVSRALSSGGFEANLNNATFSRYLQWLPPGYTASAVQNAFVDNWGIALVWFALSIVAAIVVLYLWSQVLEHSLSTPEVGGAARVRARRGRVQSAPAAQELAPAAVGASRRQGFLASQTITIAIKEWKYFWRDPQLKAMLFQSVIYVAIVVLYPIISATSGSRSTNFSISLFSVPLAVFLSTFILSYNTLGMEREGLTTLFLFPINPRRILLGKNLSVAVLGLAELILLMVITTFLSRASNLVLPVFVVGLSVIATVLACGNVTSIFFPTKMRAYGRGFRATGASSGNSGCIRSILSLAMMIVTVIVLLPVAAAAFVPLILHAEWLWVFCVPLALLYAIAIYALVIWFAAPQLLKRAPEILAVVARDH